MEIGLSGFWEGVKRTTRKQRDVSVMLGMSACSEDAGCSLGLASRAFLWTLCFFCGPYLWAFSHAQSTYLMT